MNNVFTKSIVTRERPPANSMDDATDKTSKELNVSKRVDVSENKL